METFSIELTADDLETIRQQLNWCSPDCDLEGCPCDVGKDLWERIKAQLPPAS